MATGFPIILGSASPLPALAIDFMEGSLPSLLTLTRASNATYFDSAGLVKTASSNAARFDYNPTTLTLRGLLIEESRTNLLNWSQSFATSGGAQNNWVDSASLERVSTTRTSPDGTGNALEIKANAADQTIISSASIGSSAQRISSIFMKRVAGTGNIQVSNNNGSTWATVSITTSWVRYTFSSSLDQQFGIRIRTSGDVIQIWGAQVEAGSYATSYIPTTSTTAQRQADVLTTTSLSPWYNSSESTLYIKFIPTSSDSVNNRGLAALDDGTNNNRLSLFIPAAANIAVAGRIVADTVATNPANSSIITANQVARAALAFAVGANQGALCVNGATPSTSSPAAIPSAITYLRIGSIFGTTPINGWVQEFRYYRSRLNNSALQNLTTISL